MEDFESKLVPEMSDNADPDSEDATEQADTESTDPAGQEEADESPAIGEEADAAEQVEPASDVVPKSQYDNLRKDYTRKSMELSTLKRGQVQAPAATIAKQPTTVQEFIQQQVEQSLQEQLAPIQEQQEDLRIQAKVKALSDQYTDFDEVADDFVKLLEENEQLLDLHNGLDIAFQAARSEYLERSAEAKAIASQQSKAATVAAKKAIPDTTVVTKANTSPKTEEDKIKESIFGVTSHSSTFKF